jgi:hypothetical protein
MLRLIYDRLSLPSLSIFSFLFSPYSLLVDLFPTTSVLDHEAIKHSRLLLLYHCSLNSLFFLFLCHSTVEHLLFLLHPLSNKQKKLFIILQLNKDYLSNITCLLTERKNKTFSNVHIFFKHVFPITKNDNIKLQNNDTLQSVIDESFSIFIC